MDKVLTPKKEKITDYIDVSKTKELIEDKRPRLKKIPPKDKLLNQRHSQRNILFKFCLCTIGILLGLMFIILFLQICYKWNTGKDLINPFIYNTVFVSIIIQFIGVVYIVAKKLWDEKGMLPFYGLPEGIYNKK